MKRLLIRFHWLLSSQFGIDPSRLVRSLRGLPRFLSDWRQFRKGHHGTMVLMPCLHDRYEEGGTTKSEYFWQDLLVARWIHEAAPVKHVDVGSRVDGFIAHVASFREIEVIDVRPISTVIPGIVFKQADLMNLGSLRACQWGGYCDSLSCLHALEHFGLGRYGDPINPLGYQQGIENMAQLLMPGGTFYLSTPIGKEQVEFNANWVFDPRTIIRIANTCGLYLKDLVIFTPMQGVQKIPVDDDELSRLAEKSYSLGIFTFIKQSEHNHESCKEHQ